MKFPLFLETAIEEVTGSSVTSADSCSGGCINQAAVVRLADGGELFAKWNATSPQRFFEAEAMGLRTLADVGALRVPEVISSADNGAESYLLLETLEAGESGAAAQEALGAGLAKLHRATEEEFGFLVDNFIGETPQGNDWKPTWEEFYLAERLLPQLSFGEERGWVDSEFVALFNKQEEKIRALLADVTEPPALIHGDLWSGNVFWSTRGPAITDPAAYYGNREAEIAMTELFGGFGRGFYQAYNESWPLDEGYQQRRAVHNLYHVMNHANLFGGGYVAQAADILKRL